MRTETEPICVPELGEDPDDHSKHSHVPGQIRVTFDGPHSCANPVPVEWAGLADPVVTQVCANCGELI